MSEVPLYPRIKRAHGADANVVSLPRTVDVRLPGKGNSNSHDARPVHLIIMMIKWIQTSRLSIQNPAHLARKHMARPQACRTGQTKELLWQATRLQCRGRA